MRLIDADIVVTALVYDDEREEWFIRHMTIADYLDVYTDEGCPPTIEAVPVRRGKWMEKHHAYSDEESVIEEWQSCRCSKCGRYDTRPYMYYFSEPNYCSYCGADMRGEYEVQASQTTM